MIMFAIISLPLFLSAGFTLAYVFTAGEVKYRYVTTDAICDSTGDIYFFSPSFFPCIFSHNLSCVSASLLNRESFVSR